MSFPLSIITPSGRIDREVETLRAEDSSGSFGVLARHIDFLTILKPCILIFTAKGKEGYAAVDGGIMRASGGKVTIASRQAVEGSELHELKGVVESDFYKKAEKEATFMDLLTNMEKLLLDNLVKFEKG